MAKINPRVPNSSCVPAVWQYEQIEPVLLLAEQVVPPEEAERRTLMLINPAREPPFANDTLAAGLQILMPNEVTVAHRHTAFAICFIIEGEGRLHDYLVLTPPWHCRDQGKGGSGAMVWLDGLDVPNYTLMPAHFVEYYPSPAYPYEEVDSKSSPLVFPWAAVQTKLDENEGDWSSEDYTKPDGTSVSRTLGGAAERLNAGCTSPVIRETASSIYRVFLGSGYTEINGQRFRWKQGDTFCIPAWNKYHHVADIDSRVYLYRLHNKPMLEALGYYRIEAN
ncbi:RmlC-like cupin [Trichoderma sp. SZMC 28013]